MGVKKSVRVILIGVVLLLVVVIIGVYETLRHHQVTEHAPVFVTIASNQQQQHAVSVIDTSTGDDARKKALSAAFASLRAGGNSNARILPPITPSPVAVILSESERENEKSESGRKRIAYAITINKDGLFQDGAAVLVYSILKHSVHSPYDISFVAFVHPNVTRARDGLARIGFHVIEVPVPVNVSAIKFDFLREKINKNGCCGASELIKLTSYRLTQYHRVVHLDADVIMLNPIDELFEKNYSLIYTTDPNMATFKGDDKMPAQGGFLVFQPSVEDYRSIIHTHVTTEFKKHRGWNSSHIGWFWGGMTVQGILPYYYQKVSSPKRILLVDRCYYNTMADTDECTVQKVNELKSAHFTVCQKPWNCYKAFANRLCGDLHQQWLLLREEAEKFYGIHTGKGSCKGTGQHNYLVMDLDQARLPSDGPFAQLVKHYRPDDSPDRIEPMEESMYISNNYD